MITELEFKSLAEQGYNRIPLIGEALADLETPLSLYLKLAGGRPLSFLLESVVGGERFGRYSFIGLPARTLLRATGEHCEVVTDGQVTETHHGNPLDFIEAYQSRFKVALRPGLPRFCGGLAGYFGYEAVRFMEPKLAGARREGGIGTPDIQLLQTEELAVIDNLSGRLYLIVYADPSQPEAYFRGKKRLAELNDRLRYSVTAPAVKRGPSHAVEREFARADYEAAVLRCKEYIAAGDCMQIVFGQRLRKRYTESPLSLYRALRSMNPSPYMYFYDMGDFQIVGASPEILVRHEQVPEGQKVTIRPLAGTRPRGATPERDLAVEAELLADPKERAEHLMLIDLARNDIGRIAQTGSVKVTEAFAVERYSHVMHIVSNVEGLLKPGTTNMDVLRATFPAGTLSGAPKIRAMEIIDELEPVQRGIYGGACGYLSFAGDMDVAIAIRTGIVKDNVLYVQAAAGIVADSVPELEWKETEHKARAVLRAAELVEEGF
ncbi:MULTISPECIES: anthranilate synthase component I [unclassified Methylibium]|uniref:anthranilate synthase component I n=1 Tax=unclassified Methylibium TaxID=2633235 RepID=UPI0003F46255|nr:MULTISPECIES: anthranilate synthase component I [unclassified Methylibium]EWS53512.1 Anthranilate synthase component 1 [Methylibium sp. T29]EWS58424.1 Anthranilate synthase component 1 [Methylibium sp. T29-B]